VRQDSGSVPAVILKIPFIGRRRAARFCIFSSSHSENSFHQVRDSGKWVENGTTGAIAGREARWYDSGMNVMKGPGTQASMPGLQIRRVSE
jgi:hypothetical protein